MKYLSNDSLSSLFKPFSGWLDSGYNFMKTDVKADDNGYTLSIDLPGLNKENINVSLEDGYLTVEAVRNSEDTDKSSNYVFRERTFGRMSRTFYVGEGISEDNIRAKYENGILTLNVPKYKEEEKPMKRISID